MLYNLLLLFIISEVIPTLD